MPFGSNCEYENFEACVMANSDKDNPEAYCSTLMERTEEACGKSASTQSTKIFKSYRAETKAIDDQDGYIKAIVSTEAVDRDGEVILSSAWRKTIDDFMKHPVLISSHDYNDLTKQLGEWVSLEVTDEGLVGVAKYYINMGNKEADWGYQLAKEGKSAYSVGFMAYDYQEGNGEDNAKRTYTDVELLEISQVTIPSNRDSLVTMRSKGLNPVAEEIAKELYGETINKQVPEPPKYIKDNAKRGLDLQQYAGDGLTEKTKREARLMADGEISKSKVVRMSAWFLRHEGDLKSPKADEYLRGESDRPTAGQVAWLLWGGSIEKEGRMNAQKWAERIANSLDEEKSKAPLPEADQYTTEEEALERAEEIGCEGTHTMDEDGNTIYMPCATHEEYDEIMNPSEEEEQEENPDGYGEDKGVNFVTFTKEEKQNLMKAVDNINNLEAKQTEKIYTVADAIREGVNAGLNKIKNNNSKNKE